MKTNKNKGDIRTNVIHKRKKKECLKKLEVKGKNPIVLITRAI